MSAYFNGLLDLYECLPVLWFYACSCNWGQYADFGARILGVVITAMNSSECLTQLYNLVTNKSKDKERSIEIAEMMWEIGLSLGFSKQDYQAIVDSSVLVIQRAYENLEWGASTQIRIPRMPTSAEAFTTTFGNEFAMIILRVRFSSWCGSRELQRAWILDLCWDKFVMSLTHSMQKFFI